jgi:hypothetical protein
LFIIYERSLHGKKRNQKERGCRAMKDKSLEPNDIVEIKLKRWQIPILLVAANNSLENDKDNPCFMKLKREGQGATTIEVNFENEMRKIIQLISAQSNMNVNLNIPLEDLKI